MENFKKYVLSDETMEWNGHTLHRIKAARDFHAFRTGLIKKGTLGGWVENEKNLSQTGGCWIFDDAKVYGCAVVATNACMFGTAEAYDYANIAGNAVMFSHAKIYSFAYISDNAQISQNAEVFGHAIISGNAWIMSDAKVSGNVKVFDNVNIFGSSKVFGNAEVKGCAEIWNAIVKNNADYLVFKNHFSSSGRYFTWTKSNNMWIVGCFHGNDEELIKKAYADNPRKGEYYKSYVDFKNNLLKLDEKYGNADKNF